MYMYILICSLYIYAYLRYFQVFSILHSIIKLREEFYPESNRKWRLNKQKSRYISRGIKCKNHVWISEKCKSWMELNSMIIILHPRENRTCNYRKRIFPAHVIKTLFTRSFSRYSTGFVDADAKPEMSLTGINIGNRLSTIFARAFFAKILWVSITLTAWCCVFKSQRTYESRIIVKDFIHEKHIS